MTNPLRRLVSVLGVPIGNLELLRGALIHQSYRYEHGSECQHYADTQRLEFLGDAIVSVIATQLIYDTFPDADEGTMTRLRSALIRTENLAAIARHYALGTFVIIGKGEERAGARERTTLLADVFESVVAVIYLDQGLEAARAFLNTHFTTHLAELRQRGTPTDARSQFQEVCQQRFNITPTYRTVAASGHEHDRTFVVEALVGAQVVGQGSGRSQPDARMQAAQRALELLAQQPALVIAK